MPVHRHVYEKHALTLTRSSAVAVVEYFANSLKVTQEVKVVGNGTSRQTAYEFLLVFHCNYMAVYIVSK